MDRYHYHGIRSGGQSPLTEPRQLTKAVRTFLLVNPGRRPSSSSYREELDHPPTSRQSMQFAPSHGLGSRLQVFAKHQIHVRVRILANHAIKNNVISRGRRCDLKCPEGLLLGERIISLRGLLDLNCHPNVPTRDEIYIDP